MKLEYQIVEPLSLPRLTNAEFMYFMTRFVELLENMQDSSEQEPGQPEIQSVEPLAVTDGVPELYIPQESIDAMKVALEKMLELNKETRANVATQQLAEVDRRRDGLAAFVLNAVDHAADLLSDEAELQAAAALKTAMRPYEGVGKMPQNQETVTLRGMVADLRKEQFAAAVEAVGLDKYIDKLEAENERYAELTSQRSADRSKARKLETNKELRIQLTQLYQAMADHAFAANLLHGTDATEDFINDLNSHIEETINRFNLRGPEETKEDEETPDGETPTESETPGEGTETPEEPDDRPTV